MNPDTERSGAPPNGRTGTLRAILDGATLYKLLLGTCDVLAVTTAFYLSYILRNALFSWRGGVYVATGKHLLLLLGLNVFILTFFRLRYLYRSHAFSASIEHLEQLTRAWIVFVATFISVSFFFRVQLFIEHRITVMIFAAMGWGFLYFGRFMVVPWLARRFAAGQGIASRAVVVGGKEDAINVARFLQETSGRSAILLGYVSPEPTPAPAPGGDMPPLLGGLADLPDLLRAHRVREVFISLPDGDWNQLTSLLEVLWPFNLRLRVSLAHFGALQEKASYLPDMHHGYVYLNDSVLRSLEQRLKRLMDVTGALAGLVLLSPLMLCLAAAIKLESRGPVFFRQKRGGSGGRTFDIFKFRSMRQNTEEHHREAVRRLMAGDEGFFREQSNREDPFKLTDARQVTRVGSFLRWTSLDELPQLINVLRGEMSLVGPRPEPLYQTELYKPWHHYRQHLRPGITGFWQVFGRSAVSHDDMVLMDIFYILNWSLALDLRILLRTVLVILTGKGAM